jgi:hypothetical protein
MAECKKYFRQKKGTWIYIWDNETRRNKKVCLQDFLDRMNHVLRNEKYFVLKEERNKFAEEFRSQCPFITSLK